MFACAYKRGVAGPNEIKNGGQIQNDYIHVYTNFLHYKPAYNGHNALQSEYIPGVTDEYNA